MNLPLDHLLDRAADLIDGGRRAALCVLVRTKGSTPATAGAVMLVDDAAETFGTIGGGCVEAEVRRRVLAMMSDERDGLLHFNLNHDYGWDDGLICGGRIDVAVTLPRSAGELRAVAAAHRRREAATWAFTIRSPGLARGDCVEGDDVAGSRTDSPGKPGAMCDPQRWELDLPPRPRLFIAGAGHIGQALTRFALDLDFEVHVFDDRADLLERYVPDPAWRICGPIDQRIVEARIDEETYIVVVTRGHRHDEQVLAAVLRAAGAWASSPCKNPVETTDAHGWSQIEVRGRGAEVSGQGNPLTTSPAHPLTPSSHPCSSVSISGSILSHGLEAHAPRYVGMIGSRRKVKLIFDDLREMGVSEEALSRVHAPIGIDINSVTVNEIALSIAAQLVSVRRAEHRPPVRGPFTS